MNDEKTSVAETPEELAADLLVEAKRMTTESKIIGYVLIGIDEEGDVDVMSQSLATTASTALLKALHVAGQDLCDIVEDDLGDDADEPEEDEDEDEEADELDDVDDEDLQ